MTNNIGSLSGDLLPRMLGAVVVLAVALLGARLLQNLLLRLLERAGLDDLAERTGASGSLWRLGYGGGPSRLLSVAAFWGVVLAGAAGAVSMLGIPSLQQTMDRLVSLSGEILIAIAILIAGAMTAGWLSELVSRQAGRAGLRGQELFRRGVFVSVLAVAGLLAAGQLGLDTAILLLIAAVVLASLGLTTALALGPGLVPLSGNIAAGRYVQEDLSVGDEIRVEGVEGAIYELGHSSVTLRSEDGYLYRLPNRMLLESVVRKRAPEDEREGREGSREG
ncbi:mechanosensitive ion channel family protein [Rubrobacter aplysinae]|uniref:mechanosensitive ion channel family protein n=1 Tax=Rubrobacter aplysinae TaxID=909625 RepID=UPI00064C063D|nr:mechanosensitive ion channel domain-containing protein [Rubrobacter aplysinae]